MSLSNTYFPTYSIGLIISTQFRLSVSKRKHFSLHDGVSVTICHCMHPIFHELRESHTLQVTYALTSTTLTLNDIHYLSKYNQSHILTYACFPIFQDLRYFWRPTKKDCLTPFHPCSLFLICPFLLAILIITGLVLWNTCIIHERC